MRSQAFFVVAAAVAAAQSAKALEYDGDQVTVRGKASHVVELTPFMGSLHPVDVSFHPATHAVAKGSKTLLCANGNCSKSLELYPSFECRMNSKTCFKEITIESRGVETTGHVAVTSTRAARGLHTSTAPPASEVHPVLGELPRGLRAAVTCGHDASGKCKGGTGQALDFGDNVSGSAASGDGGTACYCLEWTVSEEPFTIDVTTMAGDADLFVMLGTNDVYPYLGNEDLMSISLGVDTVTVSSTNDGVKHKCEGKSPCPITVAVSSASGSGTSTFQLAVSGSSPSTTKELELNVPFEDEILTPAGSTTDEYKYYHYQVPQDKSGRVILTPTSGDADLVLGLGTRTKPTLASNDGASFAAGTKPDFLDFHCPKADATDGHCDAYIGVIPYNHGNASYSILATMNGVQFIELTDDAPQNGALDAGYTVYYNFSLPASADHGFEVTMTALRGDPDLFISPNNGNTLPSPGHSVWSGVAPEGEERITVEASDAALKTACPKLSTEGCKLIIAVNGYTDSEYQLQLSFSTSDKTDIVTLTDRTPISGAVSGSQYKYYQYTPVQSGVPIYIGLMPSAGDADLYVLVGEPGTALHPSTTNYTFAALTMDNDTVTIFPSDERFSAGKTLYIAVHGFLTEATYSLLVYENAVHQAPDLSNGIPQRGFVHTGSLSYYAFSTNGNEGYTKIMFEASPLQSDIQMVLAATPRTETGTPAMYPQLTCGGTPGDGYQCSLDTDTFDFYSASHEGQLTVTLLESKYLTAPYTFIVAVEGNGDTGDDAMFDIVATASNDGGGDDPSGNTTTIEQLLWTFPATGFLNSNNYADYSIDITDKDKDVDFILRMEEGYGYLYGSEHPYPRKLPEDHEFNSRPAGGTDVRDLFLAYEDLPTNCKASVEAGGVCKFYLSVWASTSHDNMTYSLQATHTNSAADPVDLAVGGEASGLAYYQHFDYYAVDLNDVPAGHTLYVNLQTTGGDADLYVNIGNEEQGNFYSKSSQHMAEWYSLQAEGEDTLAIRPTDDHYCLSGCHLWISVSGFDDPFSTYTISVTTDGSITALPSNGDPIPGGASEGELTYFRLDMNEFAYHDVDVDIEIVAHAGMPSLVAVVDDHKTPPTVPTDTFYTWGLSYYAGNVLKIAHDDPKACTGALGKGTWGCAYIIGVHASVAQDAEFTIMATVTRNPPAMTTLWTGAEVRGEVGANECNYYQYTTTYNTSNNAFTANFDWEVTEGAGIDVFVTSQYRRGNSSTTDLPNRDNVGGSGACIQAITDSSVTDFDGTPGMSTCFKKGNNTWTLGICHTVIFGAGDATTTYTLSSDKTEAGGHEGAKHLQEGVAAPQDEVPSTGPLFYTFDVDTVTRDIIISVDAELGAATAYLSKGPTNPGTDPSSTNYGWKITPGFFGSGTLIISKNNPCGSASDTAKCTSEKWVSTGTWTLAVTGTGAEVIVEYELGADHEQLTDGRTLAAATSSQPVCNVRNAEGVCPGGSPNAEVAWFSLNYPMSAAGHPFMAPVAVTLDKECMSTGDDCRAITLTGVFSWCTTEACTIATQYPNRLAIGSNILNVETTQQEASRHIPIPEACGHGGSACSLYVGVYADRTDGSTGNVRFGVTVTREGTTRAIDGGCFDNGKMCMIEAEYSQPNEVTRYEGFAGTTSTNVAVYLSACRGDPTLYACAHMNGKSKCSSGMSSVGPPHQYDSMVEWADPMRADGDNYVKLGLAAETGIFFLGVTSPQTPSGRPAAASVEVQTGSAPRVRVPPQTSATAVTEGTGLKVSWSPLYINVPGARPILAKNAEYTVHLFRKEAIQKDDILDTACGIDVAAEDVASDKDHMQFDAFEHTELTIPGVIENDNERNDFTVAIVARCSVENCLNTDYSPDHWTPQQQDQVIAYSTSQIEAGPGVHHGMSGATVFFAIVLPIMLVVGGIAWFGYKKWQRGRATGGYGGLQSSAGFEGLMYEEEQVGGGGYDRL